MDRGKRERRAREGLVTSAMGEIVRRKRKGRPPKPDLSRRARSPTQGEGRTVRRSLRRRNVRYSSFIDYGDFIDDEFEFDREDEEVLEEEDEDVELRRGRKVKLVVKLSRQRARGGRAIESGDSGSEVGAVTDEGDEEEQEEEESESDGRVLKKRGISGREEEDGDLDDNDQGDDYGCEEEASGRRGYSKGHESPPGIPSDFVSEVPLPDKKTLELILDKLQKKDIYGVYAEPVDPEELPDYHDIIEKPMDFSTVRKKLANGSYTTINQFESDVFLICTNAMQYNASDTVYHKQARNIQELGRKKFLKLRIKYEQSLKENKVEQQVATDHESSERDVKSDQRVKSNLSVKKLMKKPFSRSTQEPVSSDFSGVAMPATTGDQYPNSDANQRAYNERHGVDDGLMDGNAASAENFTDKAEDVSVGRGFSFQRPCVQDENRRATYNISSHPVVRSNSIFTTFDGEIRQLVAVGLQAEYSYAQSLARFAASLGPTAWKVASQRIEQSLPSECKFGRGWVVEYEPVPTPIIFTRKSTCEFPPVVKPLSRDVFPRKQGTAFKMMPLAMKDVEHCSALDARKSAVLHGNSMGSLGSQTRKSHQVPSPGSSNRAQPETKAVKQFELNSLPSLPHNNGDTTHAPEEKIPDNSRVTDLRSRETTVASVNHLQPKKSERIVLRSTEAPVRRVAGRQMLPLAQFDINGTTRKMSTGKLQKNGLDPGRTVAAARATGTNKANKMSVPPFSFSQQDQGLSDPVQIMKLLSEKAQRLETPSVPADNQRAMKNVSSVREASGNIAAVGSWMTIGAGGNKQSIHNAKAQKIQAMSQLQYHANPQPTGVHGSEFPVSSGVQFQEEKNGIPFRGLVQNPTFGFNEARFHPQALLSPQAIPVDFSRVQVPSHWRGVTVPQPPQQRLKQDTLPPDLNIGFHSPASPVKQSPSVMVDSQQPDLALQL